MKSLTSAGIAASASVARARMGNDDQAIAVPVVAVSERDAEDDGGLRSIRIADDERSDGARAAEDRALSSPRIAGGLTRQPQDQAPRFNRVHAVHRGARCLSPEPVAIARTVTYV